MEIFISWSGKRSRAFAEALRDWLPMIINAARPFLSSSDIDKGARWSTEIAGNLEKAKAGIICLTPSNMRSEWLLFEAGALSKTLKETHVCTVLIGIKPADVKGPLSQFQATMATKVDILKLVKTLNSKLGESALSDSQIEKAFGLMWGDLNSQIEKLPPEDDGPSPERTSEDMLEELLGLVRNMNRPPLRTVDAPLPNFGLDDKTREHLMGLMNETFQNVAWGFQLLPSHDGNIRLKTEVWSEELGGYFVKEFVFPKNTTAEKMFAEIVAAVPRKVR